ncbi:MAG TPA: biotin transporter BioY [Solirubrobacteraceae bacterium]|jgi:biotin transport system substrate-specific component|nr:biotin transporter BioY [Solirubrobacteraceae bacterium]
MSYYANSVLSSRTLPGPRVLSDTLPGDRTRDVLLVVAGAGLVGLLAQISFHLSFTPVPITGQTLGVLLVGTTLGLRRGTAALLLYMLAGLAFVPWFANGVSGFPGGADFGYVVGFIFSAAACGYLAERRADRKVLSAVPAMVIGEVIMYVIGVAWLAVDLHLSIGTAISEGFVPFWIADAVKCALAAGLLPSTWRLVGRRP